MKCIRKDVIIEHEQLENIRLEKDILNKINHPFLVNMEFVFQNEQRIYFLMKFIKGGELFRHFVQVKRFPEEHVRFFTAQVALALGHLHENKIIYRDLKPENVLVGEDGYLMVADFGLAKFVQNGEMANSFCGTAEYLAPEMLIGNGHFTVLDKLGETKVRHHQVPIFTDQHVFRLQVTVNDFILVEVTKGQRHLRRKESYMFFGESFDLNEMAEKFATFNKLHQEVDALFVLENKLHVHQEWVVYLVQDIFLQTNVLELLMLNNHILADALHSVQIPIRFMLDKEYFSKGTLANHLFDLKVFQLGFLLI